METIDTQLDYLKLPFMAENYKAVAQKASQKNWTHVNFLKELVKGEAALLIRRFMERSWPKKINRMQVKNLFHLEFIDKKANVIFLGGVGLGKTHLATAVGYAACLKGYSVLFTSAIDVINTLTAAQNAGMLKQELKKYTRPALLILDELGYLPIDKTGADLLFQVFSFRYEQGAMIITSNRAFKNWPEIFNNDSTLTSAILDRLLHHAETVVIEGKSFRMKDKIEPPGE